MFCDNHLEIFPERPVQRLDKVIRLLFKIFDEVNHYIIDISFDIVKNVFLGIHWIGDIQDEE